MDDESREKRNEKQRRYYQRNKEKLKVKYLQNRDVILEKKRVARLKNIDAIKAQNKRWLKEHPEYRKEYRLLKRFGVSPEHYQEMLKAQEERCAICNRHKDEFKKSLAVDHNHNTGQIRDLLCSRCNCALGLISESLEVLDRMKAYILKWSDHDHA